MQVETPDFELPLIVPSDRASVENGSRKPATIATNGCASSPSVRGWLRGEALETLGLGGFQESSNAQLLPYRQKLIHVRWSGEAVWVPLGGFELGVGFVLHPPVLRPAAVPVVMDVLLAATLPAAALRS